MRTGDYSFFSRRPIINLGFGAGGEAATDGSHRMEIEVGSLLAELDPCVFVIDCLPNMNESTVSHGEPDSLGIVSPIM